MRVRERYQLAGELRERYRRAGRKERGEMLDGFCLATGYERKHASKVLSGQHQRMAAGLRARRSRVYGRDFQLALKTLWQASGYICSERFQPFLPELLPLLQRHGQLEVSPQLQALLLQASTSTVERNLVALRRGLLARKMSQTKPGTLLRKLVPVVVGQWKELDRPGYLEIDLVSHSGEMAAGEWIWTLTATDICSGWTERLPVMGRGQAGVLAGLQRIRQQLPFPLLGLHPDNGSEFLNWHLITYCHEHQIAISRSRPEHKNDNPHVEQKNWTLVRRLIGYRRLDTPAQLAWLDALYTDLLRPYNNCFQPVMKLVAKKVVGQRTRKLYDRPTSPLRRVLAAGAADPLKIAQLVDLYATVSPLTLQRQIERRLAALPVALDSAASA